MPSTSTTTPTATDVMLRGTQNLRIFLSRRRPWPELLGHIASISLPNSLYDAALRINLNTTHFLVNYAIIITVCAAAFLICSPIALIVIGLIFFLWLLIHLFHVDLLFLWGRHVSDLVVIMGLILVTVASIWITCTLNSLAAGKGFCNYQAEQKNHQVGGYLTNKSCQHVSTYMRAHNWLQVRRCRLRDALCMIQ